MSYHLDKFTNQPVEFFLDSIFDRIEEIGIDVSTFELDHICYRVDTTENYNRFKLLLEESAHLLVESLIKDRPISCFKLREPINYINRTISVIELPAPKSGSAYEEGYEHVEFVIHSSLEEFLDQYPAVKFDVTGMGKKINPDLRVQLGGLSVKFHRQGIEEVIEIEKAE